MELHNGVYSFRFPAATQTGLLDLFAIGKQVIQDPGYRWEGSTRTDAPLLLYQYTLAGEGLLKQGEKTYVLGPGQAFMVRIPSDHVYQIGPGGHWEVLFLLLRPEGAEALWTPAEAKLGLVSGFPRESGPIRALVDLIYAAQTQQIQSAHTASLVTYRWLIELSRWAMHPRLTAVPPPVLQALALLEEGWDRPWKLPDVAAHVGLSPSHFHRQFRRYVGLSPLEWLTRRRMEKAVELLGDPTQSVQSVARSLGFADTGYFIRLFRRWTGVTPGSLKEAPSAWAGSKIVLSKGEFSDIHPGKIPLV